MNPDLAFALESSKRAGELLLAHFGKSHSVRFKSRDHPVIKADILADQLLRERFADSYPGDAWLSEETADDSRRFSGGRVWIVDALDGTKEYIEGRPEFAISIALVEDGLPKVAVVHNPSHDHFYYAELGHGSFFNNRRVQMREPDPGEAPSILVSRTEWSRHLYSVIQGIGIFRPVGSIAYKTALVSGSKAHLVVSVTPKSEWDICAGFLLVHEAGGKLTDLSGREICFNQKVPRVDGVLAAHPNLHKKAVAWFAGMTTRT